MATFAAYTAAVALAGAAAYFSIRGMIVLFPGAPAGIIAMAVAMEAPKLVTVAWLARHWHSTGCVARAVLITLVAGLATINAAGVYSQLVAAHLGDRVTATASAESEAGAVAARVEVQVAAVADLDARLSQIDAAVSEMTRRGRAANALDAIGAQREAREALVVQRRHEAEILAGLKAERAASAAKARARGCDFRYGRSFPPTMKAGIPVTTRMTSPRTRGSGILSGAPAACSGFPFPPLPEGVR